MQVEGCMLKVACCRFASDHQQLSTCNFQLSTKKKQRLWSLSIDLVAGYMFASDHQQLSTCNFQLSTKKKQRLLSLSSDLVEGCKLQVCMFASEHQQLSTFNVQLKKNNACKPSSVSRFRELPSFIYATYPPGPDGPSSSAEEKKNLCTFPVYMVLQPARFV